MQQVYHFHFLQVIDEVLIRQNVRTSLILKTRELNRTILAFFIHVINISFYSKKIKRYRLHNDESPKLKFQPEEIYNRLNKFEIAR